MGREFGLGKMNSKEMQSKRKQVRNIIIVILFLAVMEILVFNYRHWATLFLQPENLMNYLEETTGELTTENGDYHLYSQDDATLTFGGINQNIKTIYVKVQDQNAVTQVEVCAEDAAHAQLSPMGTGEICNEVPLTQYISLHTEGITQELQLTFEDGDVTNELYGYEIVNDKTVDIQIEGIYINAPVPMHISLLRMVIEILIITFFILFRPKSELYKIFLHKEKSKTRVSIAMTLLILFVVIGSLGFVSRQNDNLQPMIDSNSWPAFGQYNELADALMDGQVTLERKPAKALENCDNPYDPIVRKEVLEKSGEAYQPPDYAYYNGNYYSYFGVLPAILFFVPYKLITGNDLHTWYMVTACSMLLCVAVFYFLYQLSAKYFRKIRLGTYLLCSIFMIFATMLVYLEYYGDVYSIPIVTALNLGLFGLGLWISASRDNTISTWRIVIGSTLIALILLCRPALILVFILAVPIFWKETIEDRQFFSIKGIRNTLLIMLPFLLVGISAMYYNWLRFQSPFDFGAQYNLTMYDMVHRGIVLERLPLGLFEYILQPMSIVPAFPFISSISMVNDYVGYTFSETYAGGVLAFNGLMIFLPLIVVLRKQLREKRVLLFSVLPLLIGGIIICIDIQVAGITQRYISDFGWLFAISTCIVVIMIEERTLFKEQEAQDALHRIVMLLVFWGVICNLSLILITDRSFPLQEANPTLYYSLKTMLPWY